MSTGITKLQEEYKFIRKSGILAQIGGSASPIEKDFLHWNACFIGPKDSPYMGGLFFIEMKFNSDYPEKGPIDVQMRTPTYHPNIFNQTGHICVTYISKWKNTNNVVGIVLSVFDLLAEENPGNGYHDHNKEKAIVFKNKYAFENQEYEWDKCWNKGWEE